MPAHQQGHQTVSHFVKPRGQDRARVQKVISPGNLPKDHGDDRGHAKPDEPDWPGCPPRLGK